MNIIGIDIAKKKFDLCLLVGSTRQQAQFSNEQAGFAVAADVGRADVEHVAAATHLVAAHLHHALDVPLEQVLAELLRAVGV